MESSKRYRREVFIRNTSPAQAAAITFYCTDRNSETRNYDILFQRLVPSAARTLPIAGDLQ